MILLGLSGIVLLVVGLNVSGMMLVRSAMRERELAIRLAMGASRWQLMRYLHRSACDSRVWRQRGLRRTLRRPHHRRVVV
jgi:hypothetical protein